MPLLAARRHLPLGLLPLCAGKQQSQAGRRRHRSFFRSRMSGRECADGKTVFLRRSRRGFPGRDPGSPGKHRPRVTYPGAALGGPIATTGVMQGMSGSPVYIDGKLGAPWPWRFLLEGADRRHPADRRHAERPDKDAHARRRPAWRRRRTGRPAEERRTMFGSSRMIDIATPVSFGGFTRETIERFAPQLRALGLEPLQGVSAGAGFQLRWATALGAQARVDDQRGACYRRFQHGRRRHRHPHRRRAHLCFWAPLSSVGSTDLPFARSEVLALLPSVSTSFKISAARELMGAISLDHSTAISGELGRRAAMVPVSVAWPSGRHQSGYQMEIVDDRFLSPFLLQMSIFSAIDATERTVGSGSVLVKGQTGFRTARRR